MIKFVSKLKGKSKNHTITKLIRPTLVPDLSHKSAVAMFWLNIGHDCLYKHLHRIGVSTSPNCTLHSEDSEMDLEHLTTCMALQNFQDIIFKYWEARRITLL